MAVPVGVWVSVGVLVGNAVGLPVRLGHSEALSVRDADRVGSRVGPLGVGEWLGLGLVSLQLGVKVSVRVRVALMVRRQVRLLTV